MKAILLSLLSCSLAAPLAFAETQTEAAIALYRAKRYPEAREALEKVTSAEPRNAAAAYYFGMTLRRGDAKAFEQAVKWLQKASELEPGNAKYLADYGGTSMEYAGRVLKESFWKARSAGTAGRDAMEKSLKIDPENLDARIGLIEFYWRAPWPYGNDDKALAHLAEIRKRNPDIAITIGALGTTDAKDYTGAFKLCDEALAQNPDQYLALYFYGRTAAISGQNLERGLTCLQKAVTLKPPTGTRFGLTAAWTRLGSIQEKLSRPGEARAAFEAALQHDSTNKLAAESLAKLKL